MKTALSICLITMIGLVIHEVAHLMAAVGLGYDAIIRLNSVTPLGDASRNHALLIAGAGPALTVAQGLLGFALARMSGSTLAFNLLVCAALQRSMAATVSALSAPNDEMRISLELGLGSWGLYAIVLILLWGLIFLAALRIKPGWAYLFWAWLGFGVGTSAMVFGESFFPTFTVSL